MRFVIVNLGCDWPGCDTVAPEGEDTVGERTITMAVAGRGTAKTFNICKPHGDELDEVLRPLLAKALKAEAVAKPVPLDDSKSVVCQVADCGRLFRSRVGLAQHVTRTHDFMSLESYEHQYVTASG